MKRVISLCHWVSFKFLCTYFHKIPKYRFKNYCYDYFIMLAFINVNKLALSLKISDPCILLFFLLKGLKFFKY